MADDTKPNIVGIWGDDIGMTNLSCYSHGIMGYRTANIDRIANEGMLFTDWYGEQSCTAGRSAFIMGQSVFRTGLSKVGIPGSPVGMRPEDPTIARLLKAKGYATGQFGKNHLGDKDEHLPTMHGFDEFFGNLYHLNAEEEPELPDYPPAADFPHFRERFGPRGVLHSWANGEGTQRVEDTGPLSKKRMETIDDEVADAASEFIRRQHGAGTPFFAWVNTTHMHFRTHPKPESIGQAGRWQSPYHDTMIDHDRTVGSLLDLLDELGIANDTFVMYSTDNGPHIEQLARRRYDSVPQREELELGGRVPGAVRHALARKDPRRCRRKRHLQPPRHAPDASRGGRRGGHQEEALQGHEAGGHTYKVHLDGYNLVPFLTMEGERSPRQGFFYFSDDGDLVALRFDNWKAVFMEQRVAGTMQIWAEPFIPLRVPKLYNLRTDPFERADITSNTYYDWFIDRAYLAVVAASSVTGEFLATFTDFPPRQKAPSFTIDQAMEKLEAGIASA
jgi:arylsulfatase